jgi:RNA polymerase sigma factor (sigma-70 family)
MAPPTSPVLRLIRRIAENQQNMLLPDEQLLRRYSAQRDEAAFRALMARHGAMVFDVCRNVLGNEANAEDAFQATFLILARKAKTIRKQASVASWLYGVAYRTACTARTRAAHRRKHEAGAVRRGTVAPSDELGWAEVRTVIHEELSRISDTYRAPLLLCYLEGHTQDEAAFQLGVSKVTVKKRLDRARALLRARLMRRGLGAVGVLLAASWPLDKVSAMPGAVPFAATVKAATIVAAKQALAGGLLSAKVTSLAQGVLRAMFLTKLTTLAAGLMVASLLAAGALVVGLNGLPQRVAAAQQTGENNRRIDRASAREATAGKAAGQEGAKVQDNKPRTGLTPTGMPSAVRQALEGNARAFAPIALTVEKQRFLPDPESPHAKRILRFFPGFLKPHSYEYLAQDEMCYARYSQWQTLGGKQEAWQELSWDGKCAYQGHLYLHPHALDIVPLEKIPGDRDFRWQWWFESDDYLAMIGIGVPRTMIKLSEGRASEVLRLLESDGRMTATATKRLPGEATDCFVAELLSDKKQHRFWLDPARGHAIRRHEVWDDLGAPEVVIDNTDFIRLTEPELWLPRHSHAEWDVWRMHPSMKSAEKTKIVVDLQVTKLERTRVPPARFTLNYGPGSYVSDGRPIAVKGGKKVGNGRVDYIQPENPGDKGIIEGPQTGSTDAPRRFLALWIVGSGLILFLAVAGVFVWIRQRRRIRATSLNPQAPSSVSDPAPGG